MEDVFICLLHTFDSEVKLKKALKDILTDDSIIEDALEYWRVYNGIK